MKKVVFLLMACLLLATAPIMAFKKDLEVTVGETARGLAISPNEKVLYVGAIRDRKVVAVDSKTGDLINEVVLSQLNPGAWAKAVWVNEKGDVFAPGSDVLEIYQFDSELFHMETYFIDNYGIADCEGAVADKDGNIYAGDRKGDGGIYKFKNYKGDIDLDTKWGNGGWVDVGDVRLACIKGGNIYVVDHASSTLYKVDLATGKSTKLAGLKANGGFAVAADDSGKVYVAHYNDSTVAVSIWDNGKVTEISRSELGVTSNLGGIAVTKDGSRMFLVEEQTEIGGLVRGYSK